MMRIPKLSARMPGEHGETHLSKPQTGGFPKEARASLWSREHKESHTAEGCMKCALGGGTVSVIYCRVTNYPKT